MEKEFAKLAATAFADFVQFISFFTAKRVVTLLIVALVLAAICSPQDKDSSESCNDNSCPMPNVITVPTTVITTVTGDSWKFDLVGENWEDREDESSPSVKVIKVNTENNCKLFLIKESSDGPLSQYAVEVIRGFTNSGVYLDSIKITSINDSKFVAAMFIDELESIWTWMAVKNDVGYTFVCGCNDNATSSSVCPETVESLIIK